MKRKTLWWLLSSLVILSLVISACATPTPEVIKETVEVEKTVEVVKTVEVPAESEAAEGTLPRKETLYYNGLQWGAVVGWNPYSNSNNNAMAISQGANARVTMFETPYLFNMLDGNVYPLLADGDYEWNEDRTEITFKLKEAAHWSDGTPVTAEDVAYTWDTHVKYNTGVGAGNAEYIEDIVAVDDKTVVVKAKLDENGEAVNPLIVQDYLSSNYVIQKAWTQKLEERVGEDPTEFLADPAEDVVYSGPYHKFFADESKVVLVRDDNYWGQDESMWGKLPVPKYLAHTIFKDNAAGSVALAKGEVDVSQQFNSNVNLLWEDYGLPISTYLPEPPYHIGASLPPPSTT
ncbi:MAG: ABC transporter substrate-binding protein [Anaerolineae bacterium]